MAILRPPLATPLCRIAPSQWPSPSKHSPVVVGTDTFVFVSGQIATDDQGSVTSVGLVPQARQALQNVRKALAQAGGAPDHIAQMTWYVLDVALYRTRMGELSAVYREIMGCHYPAMVLVEVSGLVEPDAILEISAIAILQQDSGPVPVDGPLAP